MQQCFDILTDINHAFLLLFHCCILLEIKFTTTTTTNSGGDKEDGNDDNEVGNTVYPKKYAHGFV